MNFNVISTALGRHRTLGYYCGGSYNSQCRRDQEQRGGAGLSREPRREKRAQERSRGGRWSWTLKSKEVELDSQESPGEIKRREVELGPQESPAEIKSREVELDSQESPGEIKRKEVELDSQESPGEIKSREVELDSQDSPGEIKRKEVEERSRAGR